jgi:hypothetical protein
VTRAELVQECIDRGYDYVKTSRIQGFVQRAYEEICSRYAWDFLEAPLEEDEAPLEIADLAAILFVTDTVSKVRLRGVTASWLANFYSDLTESGAAQFWYLDGNTLRVFPVSTNKIGGRYKKKPPTMADGDEPLIPSEWQYLIVDRAIVDCLKDDDEYDNARALLGDVNAGIERMASALLHRNRQNSPSLVRSGGPWDYQ